MPFLSGLLILRRMKSHVVFSYLNKQTFTRQLGIAETLYLGAETERHVVKTGVSPAASALFCTQVPRCRKLKSLAESPIYWRNGATDHSIDLHWLPFTSAHARTHIHSYMHMQTHTHLRSCPLAEFSRSCSASDHLRLWNIYSIGNSSGNGHLVHY